MEYAAGLCCSALEEWDSRINDADNDFLAASRQCHDADVDSVAERTFVGSVVGVDQGGGTLDPVADVVSLSHEELRTFLKHSTFAEV